MTPETSPLNASLQEACLIHFTGLSYVLAGDMASHEALETLEERMRSIDWNDPAFIKFSDDMRVGVPKLTPEQEAALRPQLLPILHVAVAKLASSDESHRSLIPVLKKMVEQEEINLEQTKRLVAFTSKMIELYATMRERLIMLGADTFDLEPPEL